MPQLINVLRGDMAVIGPRPTMPNQVAYYTDRQRERLAVRPGLTGWAQIQGRDTLTWPVRIEYDLWYVRNRTLRVHLVIVWRTLAVLLRPTGSTALSSTDTTAGAPIAHARIGDGRAPGQLSYRYARLSSGYASPYMASASPHRIARLDHPYVLMTNATITTGEQIRPVIDRVAPTGRPLLVVAPTFGTQALNTMLASALRDECIVVAVATDDLSHHELATFAATIGGTPLAAPRDSRPETATTRTLGRACWAAVDENHAMAVGSCACTHDTAPSRHPQEGTITTTPDPAGSADSPDLPASDTGTAGTTYRTRLQRLTGTAAHGLVQGASTAIGGALVAGTVWWTQHH